MTNLTDLEHETSWLYRARVELKISFMQTAKGYRGGAKHKHNRIGYFTKVNIDTE